jgi:ATP-independent RNA helicase DbpA
VEQNAFSSLKLKPELVKNVETMGYETMTPIQASSLPLILQGKDVIAKGKTGSGKTAAFALGLLNKLEVKRFTIQTLVLCPTRELAEQVAIEIRKIGRAIHNIKVLSLCGGMPFGPQKGSLEHGAHIIVGTPGRVDDHLRRGTLQLNNVNTLVLDEADRMLDMGFADTLDAIIEHISPDRQTLLFSATFPPQIQSIANRVMKNPAQVEAAETHDDSSIEQHLYKLDPQTPRLTGVRLLLQHHRPDSTVVFCNTRIETQAVANELNQHGYAAVAIHGELEQRDRDQALVMFTNKSINVLVATDVAARGLDIDALDMVINFDMAREMEVHIHRVGRTGRAGNKGMACTLFNDKDSYRVKRLEEFLGHSINVEPLPSISLLKQPPIKPTMVTLQIDGGKKQKLRPGDILGALTGENGIDGKQVGKIKVASNWAYVAVATSVAKIAQNKLSEGKLKGRSFRIRRIK